jgi:hypothetical protein
VAVTQTRGGRDAVSREYSRPNAHAPRAAVAPPTGPGRSRARAAPEANTPPHPMRGWGGVEPWSPPRHAGTGGSGRRTTEFGLPSLPTFSPGSTHNESTERSLNPSPGRAARGTPGPGTNGKRRSGYAMSDPYSGVSAGITEPRELRNIPGPPNRGSVLQVQVYPSDISTPHSQQRSSGPALGGPGVTVSLSTSQLPARALRHG